MPFDSKTLDRVFNPKTVVVVGDKKATQYSWLRNMKTVQGRLFSVQVDQNEIPGIEELGVTNYTSLLDVPGPVDYVLVAVPRKVVPIVLSDCVKAKVGGVGIFTSGFAETDDEGKGLQQLIAKMATDAQMPLIGPNCMGLFNPKAGVRHSVEQYHGESGPVAFIGQSGTHTIFFSTTLEAVHGIKLAKSVSFGNAAVMDVSDFIEYFAQDPEVKVIGAYIEGTKNGRRLFETLRKVAARKPVLIWKGGQTDAGARAANSHTGSMASSQAVWDALMRQTGAIRVDSLDEIVDTTAAILKLGELRGPRGALVCMTGGESVVITDTFSKQGLQVPLLSDKSYGELSSFFNVIGGSYKNPLDVSWNFQSTDMANRLLGILDEDANTDFLGLEIFVGSMGRRRERDKDSQGRSFFDAVADFARDSRKPFFAMVTATSAEKEAVEIRQVLRDKGVLAFPSFQRGAIAYRKALDYWTDRPAG